MRQEEDYLPCEIVLIEYSIEKGISKKLHRFIEPGRDCEIALIEYSIGKGITKKLHRFIEPGMF